MPTIVLLKPNRLNLLGRIWEQGVEKEIDHDTARVLSGNARFRIGWTRTDETDESDVSTPAVHEGEGRKPGVKITRAKDKKAAAIDKLNTADSSTEGALDVA